MGERIVKLETEMIDLKERNTDEHKEIRIMMKDFIDSADKKYASKGFEKMNIAIVFSFVTAIITKIVGLW